MQNKMSDEFTIHSDIPMPVHGDTQTRPPRYPLMRMHVGECFFVNAGRDEDGRREERTLRQTVSRYHRRFKDRGLRWSVLRQDDDGSGVPRIGVWRRS